MFLTTTSMVWASCSLGLNSTSSVPADRIGVCPGGTLHESAPGHEIEPLRSMVAYRAGVLSAS